jgi:hypothetical protein
MVTEALSDGWPRLREGEALARLLTHYADLGAPDREAWQDRRMDLEGVEPRELVRLHGQLLARGRHPPGVLTGSRRRPVADGPGSSPSRPGIAPHPDGTRAVVTGPRAVRCVGRCDLSIERFVGNLLRCGGPKRARSSLAILRRAH